MAQTTGRLSACTLNHLTECWFFSNVNLNPCFCRLQDVRLIAQLTRFERTHLKEQLKTSRAELGEPDLYASWSSLQTPNDSPIKALTSSSSSSASSLSQSNGNGSISLGPKPTLEQLQMRLSRISDELSQVKLVSFYYESDIALL